MPKPYSIDLRGRVIEEVETGASRREAAERYGLSPSVVVIWVQRFEETEIRTLALELGQHLSVEARWTPALVSDATRPARGGQLKNSEGGCESNQKGQEWQQLPQANSRLGPLFGGQDWTHGLDRLSQPWVLQLHCPGLAEFTNHRDNHIVISRTDGAWED